MLKFNNGDAPYMENYGHLNFALPTGFQKNVDLGMFLNL